MWDETIFFPELRSEMKVLGRNASCARSAQFASVDSNTQFGALAAERHQRLGNLAEKLKLGASPGSPFWMRFKGLNFRRMMGCHFIGGIPPGLRIRQGLGHRLTRY
jgi:hypothetical protein